MHVHCFEESNCICNSVGFVENSTVYFKLNKIFFGRYFNSRNKVQGGAIHSVNFLITFNGNSAITLCMVKEELCMVMDLM